jgi:hypothetical protein
MAGSTSRSLRWDCDPQRSPGCVLQGISEASSPTDIQLVSHLGGKDQQKKIEAGHLDPYKRDLRLIARAFRFLRRLV